MNALDSWVSQSISPIVLESVLTASREAAADRRSAECHPFFAQVMLVSVDHRAMRLSAYSREISVGGIGLLHVMPLKAGAIYEVRTEDSEFTFRQQAEAVWCRSAGHGWYLSGWRFVAAVG